VKELKVGTLFFVLKVLVISKSFSTPNALGLFCLLAWFFLNFSFSVSGFFLFFSIGVCSLFSTWYFSFIPFPNRLGFVVCFLPTQSFCTLRIPSGLLKKRRKADEEMV